MRFGCCTNMLNEEGDGIALTLLPAIAKLGYDYLELPLYMVMEKSDEEFETLKNIMAGLGIRCETCNIFVPGIYRLTGANIQHEAALDYVDRSLARAKSMGVECVVFGSGGARNVPAGFPREQAVEQLVDFMKDMAPIAEKYGITIAVEPLRPQDCNVINSFVEGCRMIETVGSPYVKMLIDLYHMAGAQEPMEHLLALGKENLAHVHIANPITRYYPDRIDEADYKSFFDALCAIGYDGRISCEAWAPNGEKDLENALAFLKRNCR